MQIMYIRNNTTESLRNIVLANETLSTEKMELLHYHLANSRAMQESM